MKMSPSHRIRLKVRANARPLNANDVTTGSLSARNELETIAMHATEIVERLHVSVAESVVAMINKC